MRPSGPAIAPEPSTRVREGRRPRRARRSGGATPAAGPHRLPASTRTPLEHERRPGPADRRRPLRALRSTTSPRVRGRGRRTSRTLPPTVAAVPSDWRPADGARIRVHGLAGHHRDGRPVDQRRHHLETTSAQVALSGPRPGDRPICALGAGAFHVKHAPGRRGAGLHGKARPPRRAGPVCGPTGTRGVPWTTSRSDPVPVALADHRRAAMRPTGLGQPGSRPGGGPPGHGSTAPTSRIGCGSPGTRGRPMDGIG